MIEISIGINIFEENKRQSLCIESLLRLKNKFKNIKLYNIQQLKARNYTHPEFITIYDEGRSAKKINKSCTTNMPIVKDFFNALARTSSDYFIFLNSDIILTSKILSELEQYDSISLSRLAINDIDSIYDTNISHSHFQIAGFDVWGVNTKWWQKNKIYFPDYIYAISAWDVDYSSRMMALGNSKLDIDFPPGCFHIIHEEKSHNNTPERDYNIDLFFNKNKPLCDAWHKFLFSVLEKRKPLCPNFTKSSPGEDQLMHSIFKDENLYTACISGE